MQHNLRDTSSEEGNTSEEGVSGKVAPHLQTSRKELHPPEGKLVDLNLFSWVWHYQFSQMNEQMVSAAQCPPENVLEDVQV